MNVPFFVILAAVAAVGIGIAYLLRPFFECTADLDFQPLLAPTQDHQDIQDHQLGLEKAIRDLDLERLQGKIEPADYTETLGRLNNEKEETHRQLVALRKKHPLLLRVQTDIDEIVSEIQSKASMPTAQTQSVRVVAQQGGPRTTRETTSEPIPAVRSFCSRCGKANQLGSRFCIHCGTSMADSGGAP